MVAAGLLQRVPYQDRRRTRHEYVLTEAGADTFPIITALAQWASGIGHTRTQGYGWTLSTAAADTSPPLQTSVVTVAIA
jgi:hypothetical protein